MVPGDSITREVSVALERDHGVGGQRIDRDVGALLAQLQRTRSRIGNYFELHPLDLGRRSPVIWIALDHDLFVLLRANEAERPGADGMAIEILAAAVRHDADRAVGQIPQQRRERLLQMEDDGVVIGGVDAVDRSVGAGLRAAQFATDERVEGPLHVARGQRLAVVKPNAMMQMEDVGLRIGNLPTFGQPRLQVEVLVAADERIEEQFVNALRLRVNPDTRIEIGGAALDDHHQRVGVGLMRAAGENKQRRTQQTGDDRVPSTPATLPLRITSARGLRGPRQPYILTLS